MINITNINLNTILNEANTSADPAAVLRKYAGNKALSYTLKWAFDNSIKSVVPAGTPPFTSQSDREDEPAEGLVIQHLKQFSYWVESGNSNSVAPARREQMFIEMLTVLAPLEARMMVAVKDKVLHTVYKKITPAIINNVFPGLLKDPLVIATPKKAPKKAPKKKKVSKKKVTKKTNEISAV